MPPHARNGPPYYLDDKALLTEIVVNRMTLIFLGASVRVLRIVHIFFDPDFLPQLQPVLASLASYFLERYRLQPRVVCLRLLHRKVRL